MPAFVAIEGRWARSLLPPAPWPLRRKRLRNLAAGVRFGANLLCLVKLLEELGVISRNQAHGPAHTRYWGDRTA